MCVSLGRSCQLLGALFCFLVATEVAALTLRATGDGDGGAASSSNFTSADGSGVICLHVEAGAVSDPPSAALSLSCTIETPYGTDISGSALSLLPFRRSHSGLGKSSFKFLAGPPPGTPNADSATNSARSGTTPETKADASGRWSASVSTLGPLAIYRATHNVTASLDQPDGGPAGEAVAESADPLMLEFDAAGSLDFAYFISGVNLLSDALDGEAIYATGAGFSGVTFGGIPIDGELFRLGIGVRGASSSMSNADVIFEPAPELGLTAADIASMESFIFSFLTSFPDGSTGFGPGVVVPIFGDASPLGSLRLEHAGSLVYDTFATANLGLASAPSSLVNFLAGLLLLAYRSVRARPGHGMVIS